jgi:anti-sigma B factor antagonist
VHTSTAEIKDGPLVLTTTETGSTRTVATTGELDLSNVGTLAGLLDELESDGAEAILIDLEALEFIDSAGLALLVQSHKRLNCDGQARLRLVPARALGVRRVLALTGLDEQLPFVEEGAIPG